MSRPRTTPLARDDSPAAMMAAGVPGDDEDLELASPRAGRGRPRGRPVRDRQPARAKSRAVKHRPAPATGRQVEPQCLTDATGAWPALVLPVLPLLDVRRARTVPAGKRAATAAPGAPARRLEPGLTAADFLSRLPDTRGVSDLRDAADAIARARLGGRGVVLGVDAEPIAAGLSPLIVDLMERGVITAVALHGAALAHDFELAVEERKAEGGAAARGRGRPGAARSSAELLNRILREAASVDEGIGEAVGRYLAASRHPHRTRSIAAAGARLGIPVTAHVAIGSDGFHAHPSADGAALGATALRDFHRFAAVVAGLAGGVYVDFGGAVPLSGAFRTALELARELGHPVRPLTTIDLGVAGQPELLFPLLVAAILDRIAGASPQGPQDRARRRPRSG